MTDNQLHAPVLCSEITELLTERSSARVFMDLTLGDGGHTAALLAAAGDDARVVGVDQDTQSIARARQRLGEAAARVHITHCNFSEWPNALRDAQVDAVDGIVADLGFSSMQVDTASRGLSFMQDGPLDMRLDASSGEAASTFVNSASAEELEACFRDYGEERFARRIAHAICDRRIERPFAETADLADVVRAAIPAPVRHRSRIHPATRVFQALRIQVNDELGHLTKLIESAPQALAPGGRMAVISYHSLEDRIVKHGFRAWAKDRTKFRVITKKPMLPSDDEIARNPRARSAKLRVIERLEAA